MGGLIAIYDMYDEEGNAFYVGQTSRPIEKRRDEHYDRCRWERTDTALKVRELRARGIKPGCGF
jgi:hypothetical protein